MKVIAKRSCADMEHLRSNPNVVIKLGKTRQMGLLTQGQFSAAYPPLFFPESGAFSTVLEYAWLGGG
jgi:hypothetical protein